MDPLNGSPMSVLVRVDIGTPFNQVIGVFSREEDAIYALSSDISDHMNIFADSFIRTEDECCCSLTNGKDTLYIWYVIKRNPDEPKFMADAAELRTETIIEKEITTF